MQTHNAKCCQTIVSLGDGGPCPAGHYCLDGTTDPEPCPVGTFSNRTKLISEVWL